MRVLILTASYPPVLGGLQTVAHSLAMGLIAYGHQIQVVTQRWPRPLRGSEVIDGVPIMRWQNIEPSMMDLRRGRVDLFLASLVFSPLFRYRLGRLVWSFQPTVVNVHFPDSQIHHVLWLKRKRPFRLVVSLHGHDILRWDGAPRTERARGLRTLLRVADAVTACSGFLLEKAVQLEPAVASKGHVIHNGIDLERFKDRSVFPHPRPYVLAFGRLTHEKGFDLLIDAWKRVAADYPGFDLILAGDGEERGALAARAERLGLANRVRFTGRVDPAGVVHLLNGCRLVVVPSREEPFGITALEAMAAGKPVVATRVGGLPEFVPEPPNRLVSPTVDGLVEGLCGLVDQPETARLTTDRANRDHAARFTWSRALSEYLRVLEPAAFRIA